LVFCSLISLVSVWHPRHRHRHHHPPYHRHRRYLLVNRLHQGNILKQEEPNFP
jgi:hypothetical protein